MSIAMVLKRFLGGAHKTAVCALTTQCNCKCMMCGMWRKKPMDISLENAKRTLNFLYKNKFLIVYFTGGEPTLHPNIVEIVKYANQVGLITAMSTNGTASRKILRTLKEVGLSYLSVSLDHWDSDICEKIRGHKDIMQKQTEAIKYARQIGLRTYALTYLNLFLLRDGVEKLVRYVNQELDVPFGFCYPVACDVNSYSLKGAFTEEKDFQNLQKAIFAIASLKKRKYKIANDGICIEDMLRSFEGKPPNFYCRAGQDVVYIDWLGDAYPCFFRAKLFNVLNNDKARFLENVKCNDCFTNCFREPSLIPQISSPRLLLKEIISHPSKDILL